MSVLTITADDRERGSGVVKALREADDVAITVERLKRGGYRVANRLVFERKALPDLATSIADGRLFRQATRLATVRGVGDATAEKIRWAVNEDARRYA